MVVLSSQTLDDDFASMSLTSDVTLVSLVDVMDAALVRSAFDAFVVRVVEPISEFFVDGVSVIAQKYGKMSNGYQKE